MNKKMIEDYLKDRAWEIGQFLEDEKADVFITVEKDGKRWAEGNYLYTGE